MENRKGKSQVEAMLRIMHLNTLYIQSSHKQSHSIWIDELTEEPQKVYNKQPKRKAHRHVHDGSVAQWKREINPRKH